MIPTLIAAAVVGVLAPLMRARAWRVPFGLLSIATVLRAFFGAFLTVLVIGSVADRLAHYAPCPVLIVP